MTKPFAPSCERNQGPILEVLQRHLGATRRVLEIGSGTGQHAVHFAAALPHLRWQTTEQAPAALPGIAMWLDEAALANTPPPQVLDVTDPAHWQRWAAAGQRFDAVFTANTLHYMPWASVQALFTHLPGVLAEGAAVVAYGPFNLDGRHTSESNAQFDLWLKERDARLAIRHFEAVDALAAAAGLQLQVRLAMPANNFCVVWQRAAAR